MRGTDRLLFLFFSFVDGFSRGYGLAHFCPGSNGCELRFSSPARPPSELVSLLTALKNVQNGAISNAKSCDKSPYTWNAVQVVSEHY